MASPTLSSCHYSAFLFPSWFFFFFFFFCLSNFFFLSSFLSPNPFCLRLFFLFFSLSLSLFPLCSRLYFSALSYLSVSLSSHDHISLLSFSASLSLSPSFPPSLLPSVSVCLSLPCHPAGLPGSQGPTHPPRRPRRGAGRARPARRAGAAWRGQGERSAASALGRPPRDRAAPAGRKCSQPEPKFLGGSGLSDSREPAPSRGPAAPRGRRAAPRPPGRPPRKGPPFHCPAPPGRRAQKARQGARGCDSGSCPWQPISQTRRQLREKRLPVSLTGWHRIRTPNP